MSRQSKLRNKRKAQLAAKLARPPKPHLTPEQKQLRKQQAAQLLEAQQAEKERLIREAARRAAEVEARRQRAEERKRARTTKRRSQTSSPTSAEARKPYKTKVTPHGTILTFPDKQVVSRHAVHVATYPASAKIMLTQRGAVIIKSPDEPPVMLDYETGRESLIDVNSPSGAKALITTLDQPNPSAMKGS